MARTAAVIEDLETPKEGEKPAESTEEQESSTPKLSSIGFFEQLSRFNNVEWEQHIIYVYRLAPITDRTAGGTTKYVQKYASRFDQETLKADLGSGRYRLQLNRYGDKGQSKTVRTFEIDIEDMNFPPKVPPGEWLDDPRNKRWAWARNKQDAIPAGGDPWTPERITRMVKELRPDVTQPQDQMSITKAVLDAVKETRAELGAANNPASMITLLKELILIAKPAETDKPAVADPLDILTRAKALFAGDSGKTDAVVTLLTEQLKTSREDAKMARESAEKERQRNHELQLKMMEQKNTAADPLDMVNKVLNLQEKLGGGQQSRRPGWPGLLEDHADRLLDLGEKALGAIAYKRSQPAPAPNQQQRPSQQQPAPNTQVQQTPPAQPQGETVAQQPTDPDIAFLLPILESQGRRFVTAFKNDPLSGGEVARSVILYADNATYERIARMGRVKILATIDLLPEMKADLLKVGTQEMLNEFIDDFVAGPEDPDEDDDGDDDNGDDDPEPGFADPANPEAQQPPRSGIPKTLETARPKHKKKVPA